MIASFSDMMQKVKQNGPMRLACAAAEDEASLCALQQAEEAGIAVPILLGDPQKIGALMEEHHICFKSATVIPCENMQQSCEKAVAAVKNGDADFLMKGLVDTSIFLKAILNKERGLPVHGLLSHVMTFDTCGAYHKLAITSDGGMVPYPQLEQKQGIIKNALQVARALEIEEPKVSVLCAKEKVNPKMPATVDAAALKQMGEQGVFGDNVIVEGPIALDLAVSKKAAEIKSFFSPVCGETDIFIFPNIEAGNIMGKTFISIYDALAAGVVVGCSVPIVMCSRSDSDKNKLYSIAMGSLMAARSL